MMAIFKGYNFCWGRPVCLFAPGTESLVAPVTETDVLDVGENALSGRLPGTDWCEGDRFELKDEEKLSICYFLTLSEIETRLVV